MNLVNKWSTNVIPRTTEVIDVVRDSSISTVGVADGKNIPLLILDTSDHPDIESAISMHKYSDEGKVSTIWGKSLNGKQIILSVEIIEPYFVSFNLIFDSLKKAALIDLIISSQLLYIQSGTREDRIEHTLNNYENRLLIEVPSSHFQNEWLNIFMKVQEKHFKKLGYSKMESKKLSKELYNEWGLLRDLRMK